MAMFGRPWVLVLAAGAGRRLSNVTGTTPKQFFRPADGPSLLENTLERFGDIATPTRTVTVVDRSHRTMVADLNLGRRLGEVLYQEQDRGTATGVLLGLSTILDQMPHAFVIMTPSDHAVSQSWQFRAGLTMAMGEVSTGRTDIVLFGAEPTNASPDYGWITPSDAGSTVRSIDTFVEKPTREEASRLLKSGAVWNTMVLLARATALERLFAAHLPDHAAVFAQARTLNAVDRPGFLREAYAGLPFADFSRDVLTPSRALSLYTWPAAMGWSDLGTPERFNAWNRSMGRWAMTGTDHYAASPIRY
jgi:mannose-1-phosphate guanylyltransferase